MRLPKLLPILLLLTALAIAGCGGGGDDSTETTAATTSEEAARLSKADFIKQGDAICAEVNSAVGAIGASETEVQSQTTQVSDLYVGMVESLKRLGAPTEMDGYADFMEAAEELAKVEGEVKLAAEREDTEALGEAATAATPALEGFENQAGIYGFEECSEGPQAPPPAGAGAEAGGEEVAPEGSPEAIEEEIVPEVEEVAPETGGAVEEAAPEGGGTGAGTGGGETGGSSGGIGPG
ncbi:MAG: hypothetical protein ABW065_07515 [Solirubrobacterales bacterium]